MEFCNSDNGKVTGRPSLSMAGKFCLDSVGFKLKVSAEQQLLQVALEVSAERQLIVAYQSFAVPLQLARCNVAVDSGTRNR